MLEERGDQMARLAGWAGREIIVVISWYSDDLSPVCVPVRGQQAVDRLILAGQLSQWDLM